MIGKENLLHVEAFAEVEMLTIHVEEKSLLKWIVFVVEGLQKEITMNDILCSC